VSSRKSLSINNNASHLRRTLAGLQPVHLALQATFEVSPRMCLSQVILPPRRFYFVSPLAWAQHALALNEYRCALILLLTSYRVLRGVMHYFPPTLPTNIPCPQAKYLLLRVSRRLTLVAAQGAAVGSTAGAAAGGECHHAAAVATRPGPRRGAHLYISSYCRTIL